MITEDLGLRWGASSTIDVGDDQEALNLLYRAGCRILFIGLETLNQENLKWIGKKYVSERYIEQLHRIRENGICVAAFFTLGLDGDDWFTFKNLFDFIRRSRIALSILNLLLPIPGTKIFEKIKKGRLLIKNEEDFLHNNSLCNTPCNSCFFYLSRCLLKRRRKDTLTLFED